MLYCLFFLFVQMALFCDYECFVFVIVSICFLFCSHGFNFCGWIIYLLGIFKSWNVIKTKCQNVKWTFSLSGYRVFPGN